MVSRLPPVMPIMLAAALSMLAGLGAGLARMGWDLPTVHWSIAHGPLMLCGFFGTVIGIERAVALARPWAFAAPLSTAGGAILILGGAAHAGPILIFLGSLVFLFVTISVARRQPEPFTRLMALAALAWVAGNGVWAAGGVVSDLVPAWAAFLVLTINAERLELSRFLKPWRWRLPSLVVPVALIGLAAILSISGLTNPWPFLGAGLICLTVWSLINDVARRTILQTGLTRYVAVCLLSGYGWMLMAGLLALPQDQGGAGYGYDALLHALLVGFVFSMVFGHAPVILPAVLKLRLPFHLGFYLPLAGLHLSLALRIIGDLWQWDGGRQWGGLLNAASILAFILMVLATTLKARSRRV